MSSVDLKSYGADQAAQVLAEIEAAASVSPTATIHDLYQHVSTMYQQAEAAGDAQTMQIVSVAWQGIQQYVEAHDQAVTIAAAARAVAVTLKEQRDAAVVQYSELTEAMQDLDQSHPLVNDLIEIVEDNFNDYLMCSGIYVSDDPVEDLIGMAEVPISRDQGQDFHAFIAGLTRQNQDIEEVEYHALAEELAHFVGQFTTKIQRAQQAHEEIRKERRRAYLESLSTQGQADDE